MSISRSDQKQFAHEVLAITDNAPSEETIASLSKLVSLLVSWVGKENSIAVNLSEYIGELKSTSGGGQDTGWRDYNKEILLKDLNS